MAFIARCLKNVWYLKINAPIGPLYVIGVSTLSRVEIISLRFWLNVVDSFGVELKGRAYVVIIVSFCVIS